MRALGAAAAVAVVAAAIHASRTLLAAYRERLRLEIESALQAQPPSEAPPPAVEGAAPATAVEGAVVGVPAVVHGTADEHDGSVPTRRELVVQLLTLGTQMAQVVELAQQEKARATAALTLNPNPNPNPSPNANPSPNPSPSASPNPNLTHPYPYPCPYH